MGKGTQEFHKLRWQRQGPERFSVSFSISLYPQAGMTGTTCILLIHLNEYLLLVPTQFECKLYRTRIFNCFVYYCTPALRYMPRTL